MKDLEVFKQNAKKGIDGMIQRQSDETEAFSAGPFREFADATKAALEKEAKDAGKELNEVSLDERRKKARTKQKI